MPHPLPPALLRQIRAEGWSEECLPLAELVYHEGFEDGYATRSQESYLEGFLDGVAKYQRETAHE